MTTDDHLKILQDLWYNIQRVGYTALKKEHVPIILEHGSPREVAALIVNGVEEPRKHSDSTVITIKKAEKIAEKYSKFEDYQLAIIVGNMCANMEPVLKHVRLEYINSVMVALNFLKGFIERQNVERLLSGVYSIMPESKKPQMDRLLDEYNESCQISHNISVENDIDITVLNENGRLTVSNSSDISEKWKSLCQEVSRKGSLYKTYIKAVNRWLLDSNFIICAPTDMIKIINSVTEDFVWNGVPYEYTARYLKDKAESGISITREERNRAVFPDYNTIPIYNEVEDLVNANIKNTISRDYRI